MKSRLMAGRLFPLSLLALGLAAAQPAAKPTQNSAQVRFVHASSVNAKLTVTLNGKALTGVTPATVGSYIAVPAGERLFTLKVGKEPALELKATLEPRHSYTVPVLGPAAAVRGGLLSDEANTSTSQAQLSIYHLAASLPSLSISATGPGADAKPVVVVPAIKYGASGSITVSPVKASLVVSSGKRRFPPVVVPFAPGGSYSIFVVDGPGGPKVLTAR